MTSADKVLGTVLEIIGRNSIRPAGDTAEAVGVYAGGPVGSACRGRLLGRTEVDPGSGEWRFSKTVSAMPHTLCVRSTGGGILEMEVGP